MTGQSPFLAIGMFILGTFLFDWWILLKFFYLKMHDYIKKMEHQHGPRRKLYEPHRVFNVLVLAPVLEECVFRGPVLIMSYVGPMIATFIVLILCSILFGFVHTYNEIEFSDGTRHQIPTYITYVHGISGFLYGLSAIISESLWPAVFAHFLWNFSVLAADKWIDERRIVKFAKMLSAKTAT